MNKDKINMKNKWFKILLIIVGIILIVFGLYTIFGKVGKVSRAFLNKFNEIQNVLVVIGNDMQDAGNLLTGIGARETAKDYQGAVFDLNAVLDKMTDIETQAKDLETKAAELKTMADVVKDTATKDSGLKFVDLIGQTSAIDLKIVDEIRQLMGPAKKYYEDLAAGKKATFPASAQYMALGEKLQADVQTAGEIGVKFDAASKELAKVAGFKLKPIKK